MALTLRDALAIAKDYVTTKPPEGMSYNVVVLRDGYVRATTGEVGCEIPCAGIDGINLAVDHAALSAMLKAVGGDVTLSSVKGRQLQIKGAGVTYKLKAIPADSEPDFPDLPKKGWHEITKDQAVALSAVASLVDTRNPNQALTGIRLTPEWCAGASRDSVAFAWISGMVKQPFTSPPGIFSGVEQGGDLVVNDGRLFLRATDESVRWSLGYVLDWPDESLVNTITSARGGKRSSVTVDLADVSLMCRQAAVVAADAREGFKLAIKGGHLTLAGMQGVADYSGKISVEGHNSGAEEEWVGVRPDRLGAVCGVVATVKAKKAFMSLGGPLLPILVWNEGGVVIEALNMPMRLSGE